MCRGGWRRCEWSSTRRILHCKHNVIVFDDGEVVMMRLLQTAFAVLILNNYMTR
jgi:hypothetical protein